MDIFDQILENLELERELGTRAVEIDRALLVPPKVEVAAPKTEAVAKESKVAVPKVEVAPPKAEIASPKAEVAAKVGCDILFLTAAGLSDAGMEAMRKIFAAMRKIRADVKVALDEDVKAKVVVLLGADALRRHAPTQRLARGTWMDIGGVPTITTFSPDFIFKNFQDGSPSMVRAKKEMWDEIKLAIGRIGS